MATRISMGSLADLDGYWKVIHHGNVSLSSPGEKIPRVQIYFSKLHVPQVPVEKNGFEASGEIKYVNIPIGELMRLPLGVVIQDRKIAFDPKTPYGKEIKDSFSLCLTEENVKMIARHETYPESDEAIIPVNERTPPPGCPTGSSHYVSVGINDDPYGLIIPCHEVFRFFYCTSSKMAKTMLSDKILDVDRYLINPDKSFIDEKLNIGVIWLRQWMANSDRFHLARLFFTEGKFGEAKKIFLRAAGRAEEEYERELICLPPMDGDQSIECIGKWIKSGGKKRFFVYRILNSDWSLPFSQLHYGRDNDAEKVASTEEREELPDSKREGKPGALDKDSPIGNLEDKPGDDSLEEIELSDEEFGARYPMLQKIQSPKIPKEIQKTKGSEEKRTVTLEGGTVVEGQPISKQLAPVMISSLEDLDDYREFAGDTKEDIQTTLDSDANLANTIRILEHAAKENTLRTSIKYLQVMREGFWNNGKRLNLLPKKLANGKSYAWFFLDTEKTLRRPVLVAELSKDGQRRYLVEFHRRQDKVDTSMLVLWTHEGGQITSSIIVKAIEACMEHKSISLREKSLFECFCGKKFKHTYPASAKCSKDKFAHLINRIFDAGNEMEKLMGT